MKKLLLVMVVVALGSGLMLGVASPKPLLAADPVEINLVSFIPKMNPLCKLWINQFVKEFNERGEGKAKIVHRGGPEVIGPFDQGRAVAQGQIDMALAATTMYSSLVKGADTIRNTHKGVKELRANGYFEALQEIHAKAGIYFVGWGLPMLDAEYYFILVLKKPIEGRNDIKGLKLGGSPAFLGFIESLGGIPVKLAMPEYYSAAERGVSDGNICGYSSYLNLGLVDVAPYIIDTPFYKGTLSVIVNMNKWNSFPKDVQQLFTDVQLKVEETMPAVFSKDEADFKQKAVAKGAKLVKFSPEDAKWYRQKAEDAGWAFDATRYPADLISKFQGFLK